jgi:succinate dehydrogenase/fumarate reductase flavoprotein subunit
LAREESRGEHQRADFVDQSDEFTYASLLRRGADGDPELTSNFEYEAVGQTIRVGK